MKIDDSVSDVSRSDETHLVQNSWQFNLHNDSLINRFLVSRYFFEYRKRNQHHLYYLRFMTLLLVWMHYLRMIQNEGLYHCKGTLIIRPWKGTPYSKNNIIAENTICEFKDHFFEIFWLIQSSDQNNRVQIAELFQNRPANVLTMINKITTTVTYIVELQYLYTY